jgi:hypothetical protein
LHPRVAKYARKILRALRQLTDDDARRYQPFPKLWNPHERVGGEEVVPARRTKRTATASLIYGV